MGAPWWNAPELAQPNNGHRSVTLYRRCCRSPDSGSDLPAKCSEILHQKQLVQQASSLSAALRLASRRITKVARSSFTQPHALRLGPTKTSPPFRGGFSAEHKVGGERAPTFPTAALQRKRPFELAIRQAAPSLKPIQPALGLLYSGCRKCSRGPNLRKIAISAHWRRQSAA